LSGSNGIIVGTGAISESILQKKVTFYTPTGGGGSNRGENVKAPERIGSSRGKKFTPRLECVTQVHNLSVNIGLRRWRQLVRRGKARQNTV